MTTAKLSINYTNYKKVGKDDFEPTASFTQGISIYNQLYSKAQSYSNSTDLSLTDIIKILNTVVACEEGYELVEKADSTSSYSGLALLGLDVKTIGDKNCPDYVMSKNQILVFKSTQSGYVCYYCYLKDDNGNSWVIYITSPSDKADVVRIPVVFDIQDDLEPTFTKNETETSYSDIRAIKTGNFELYRSGTEWLSNVKLKNTSFNVATDDNKEGNATIVEKWVIVAAQSD